MGKLGRQAARVLLVLAAAYALLAVAAWFLAGGMMFFPPPPQYSADASGLTTFSTSEGEGIAAVYFPPRPGRPTLLYSHGNAEDIANSAELYDAWRSRGWGVLAYDYPGYGLSSGSPTEKSCYRGIEAAWEHLIESGIDPADIVVVGNSIGSGPSVWLAAREQPRALVLFSPLASVYSMRPPLQHLLPGDRFPNLDRIAKVTTPTLVIHGEQDRVVPTAHGRRLVEASAAAKKEFVGVPERGHNDLFSGNMRTINDRIAGLIDARD